MAGHSKWANIQHRKGAQDVKRGKLFTKLIREITVSARLGGGDASSNPRLRAAVDKALAGNMTKDTIERAVKRGAGTQEGDDYEELRYEGYGPGGIAVIVDCMTDNRNRTVAEVRHAFSKAGGNLGTDGSVAYLFEKLGILSFPKDSDENRIMDVALEAGAQDVVQLDDASFEVLTEANDFYAVKEAMELAKLTPNQAEVTMRATTTIALDLNYAEKLLRLLEGLDDLDDVQQVYSNADISDEVLEKLASY
ncbi:MAG: YebC/PmpR family DNA-binding transcriptional regulator [Thiomargarita sp.]|nr:YebC/PmpR family DNA-binding transcriptional regulator [Thiomargarita sp.]